MDAGHNNCRDYYLKPEEVLSEHIEPMSTARILAARAARVSQKSPLSASSRSAPAFPFLQLPLELRRHVYSYLLPCTEEQRGIRDLLQSIGSKRLPPTHHNLAPDILRQMLAKPAAAAAVLTGKDNIIWRRGQTALLAVCRRFHDECAEMLYGESTFIIFVAYDSITFRFRWILPNGLTPNRTYDFLELVPVKYLRLIKRLVVTVDHVDSYTGQIKYNVGGKGLTYGLKSQVAKLIRSVKTAPVAESSPTEEQGRRAGQGIKTLSLRLLNGNDHLDTEKRNMVKAREVSIRGVEEVQTVLEPLMELKGLVSLDITGAVTEAFIERLRAETMHASCLAGVGAVNRVPVSSS